MLNVIGCEIKNNFFVFLSEKINVDHSQICSLWDQYFSDAPVTTPAVTTPAVTTPAPVTTILSSTKNSKPVLKTKKVPLKDKKDKMDCLLRSDQTPINFGDIDKMKVAELKKYNKERGLPISGTKAALIDCLKKYEQNDKSEDDDDAADAADAAAEIRETKNQKPITVLDPKTKTNKKKNEVVQAQIEAVIEVIDGEDVPILDGNLVCEEENNELIVIGCLDETGCIVKLSRENVERCKELQVKFNPDDVE
jgi:hypothetical protein